MAARKNRPGKHGTVPATPNLNGEELMSWVSENHLNIRKTGGGYDVWSLFPPKFGFLVFNAQVQLWSISHNMHPGNDLRAYKYKTPADAWTAFHSGNSRVP